MMARTAHTAMEPTVHLTIPDLAPFTEAVDTIISAHTTALAIPDNTPILIQVLRFVILPRAPLLDVRVINTFKNSNHAFYEKKSIEVLQPTVPKSLFNLSLFSCEEFLWNDFQRKIKFLAKAFATFIHKIRMVQRFSIVIDFVICCDSYSNNVIVCVTNQQNRLDSVNFVSFLWIDIKCCVENRGLSRLFWEF